MSVCPKLSAEHDNVLVLRSFGKFYGLAGLRLGFAVGGKDCLDQLEAMIGRWAVSGLALAVGREALQNTNWALDMTSQLASEADLLDRLVRKAGGQIVGGTSLFRLYEVDNAVVWQEQLAKHQIWTRTFSYKYNWLRLGLPPEAGWERLKQAFTC